MLANSRQQTPFERASLVAAIATALLLLPLQLAAQTSPSVTAGAAMVNPGGVITVTVANGPRNIGDWVGLYDASASSSGYLEWKYLNGLGTPPASGLTGATLTFTAPTMLGTYNVR